MGFEESGGYAVNAKISILYISVCLLVVIQVVGVLAGVSVYAKTHKCELHISHKADYMIYPAAKASCEGFKFIVEY